MACVAVQGGALLCTLVWAVCCALLALPGLVARGLLRHLFPDVPADWTGATFWEGDVYHIRRKPARNQLRYRIRLALVDLDASPGWFQEQAADHLSAGDARELAGTSGRVLLLTNPISAGYVQNPISVYYCYSGSGALDAAIAEVTNTPWAERVTFLFDPAGSRVPKALHVSPMMDMRNTWYLESSDPLKDSVLKLVVNADHPEHGRYFDASLTARLSSMPHHPNERASWGIMRRHAFQPHRIAFWIYAQAVVILWKGVPFYPPPDKSYQEALPKLQQSQHVAAMPSGARFLWRNAEWPWN